VGNILGSTCINPPMYAALPKVTISWANTTPQTWLYDPGTTSSFSSSLNVIFRLGYPSSGNNGYDNLYSDGGISDLGGLDLTVRSNTIIHANYDFANKTVTYSPSITDHAVPSSYYLASKPSWWDNNSPWPPYDANNISSATLTNLPAAKRFFFGINYQTNTVSGNQPPVAMATAAPTSGLAPLTVAFLSAGSSDPEGATLTYNWTFGDGATSTAANPSHIYQSAGTYVAQLTVSDGVNMTTSSNMTITVTSVTLPAVQGLQITNAIIIQ